MIVLDIPDHQIADDAIRHACSEIYLTVKHARTDRRLDDQEYQLILAKLRQIESALVQLNLNNNNSESDAIENR